MPGEYQHCVDGDRQYLPRNYALSNRPEDSGKIDILRKDEIHFISTDAKIFAKPGERRERGGERLILRIDY